MENSRFVEGRACFPAAHLARIHFSHSNKEAIEINYKQTETHEWAVSEDEARVARLLVSERRSTEFVGVSPAGAQSGGESEGTTAKNTSCLLTVLC